MNSTNSRFWNKVNKNGQLILDTKCWEWTACLYTDGYGQFYLDGKLVGAHRFSWELKNGFIPDGLFVLHKCDNRTCVNLDHLFLGTKKENSEDMVKKGRSNKLFGEDHGSHKLSDEEVVNIRNKYSTGLYSQKELAEEFSVSQTQISNIANFKQRSK